MDPEMEARQPFKIANFDRILHQNIDISIVITKKDKQVTHFTCFYLSLSVRLLELEIKYSRSI